MGRQIIKQPNGLFALWTSHCDNFLLLNATPSELIEFFIEEEVTKIKESVPREITNLVTGERKFPGMKTWEEALERVEVIHGENEVLALRRAAEIPTVLEIVDVHSLLNKNVSDDL